MDDVCTPGNLAYQFFNKFDHGFPTRLCTTNIDSETIPFAAELESRILLAKWLRYRGYIRQDLPHKSQQELAQMATQDMKRNNNTPPFSRFVSFAPHEASDVFLIMWLSWYGVTSLVGRDRRWWEETARQIQQQIPTVANSRPLVLEASQLRAAMRRLEYVLHRVKAYVDDIPDLMLLTEKQQQQALHTDKRALARLSGGDYAPEPMVVRRGTMVGWVTRVPIRVMCRLARLSVDVGKQAVKHYLLNMTRDQLALEKRAKGGALKNKAARTVLFSVLVPSILESLSK